MQTMPITALRDALGTFPCVIAALAVAMAASPAPAAAAVKADLFVSKCSVDGEIPKAERAKVDALGRDVAQALAAGNNAAIYADMASEVVSKTSLDAFSKAVQSVPVAGGLKDIKVAHTYLIETATTAAQLPPTICGKSLTDPEAVLLATRALPRQFHVQLTARSPNNGWSLFLWVVPEDGGLKVLGLDLNMSSIAGHDARDLHRLALAQRSQGHDVNAALLLAAAEQTAGRGRSAAPIWKKDIDKDATVPPPKLLQGKPPYQWSLEGQTFTVQHLTVLGIGGKLDLILERRPATWAGEVAVDAENRVFISALAKAYPQLSNAFGALVARTFKPDGTGGFATVYEFGKGFD